MRQNNKKKIGIIVIIIFFIINILWLFVVNFKYYKFVKVVPKNNFGIYALRKGEYTYSIHKPFYLRMVGNLAIAKDGVNHIFSD